MNSAQALNQKFGIPGVAQVFDDRGGLASIHILGDARRASGAIYLHGAHVTSWKPPGYEEVLFLSQKSAWQDNKPIRGGVPLCFPWFGPREGHPDAPMHGFARLKPWALESIKNAEQSVIVSLVLHADEATRAAWPFEFTLRYRVKFGSDLTMSLELNCNGPAPLTAEEAQHTYFSVGDARQIRILGLDQSTYIDKTDSFKIKPQSGPITITGETNRIYANTAATLTLEDPVKQRRITVTKQNSRDTVIWNPWIERAREMPDFDDDEWPTMQCIESCNLARNAPKLAPGQSHVMTTLIQVAPI